LKPPPGRSLPNLRIAKQAPRSSQIKLQKLQELNTKLGGNPQINEAIGDQMKESAGGITSLVKEMGAGLAAASGLKRSGSISRKALKRQ